jgi:NADH dehydrogenase
MEITTVAMIGGSGFVGRHICHRLAAEGYRVRVATRDRERTKDRLIFLPTVEVESVNVHDPRELAAFARGADALMNLVAVLHEGRGEASFQAAHVELAAKVVSACRESGVRRLIHMSALQASAGGPSRYLRSKGEAEGIVRDSDLRWTIFRPSVIFGNGDSFLNVFARLLRLVPVVFLACPNARFQPVFVEDVATAFARSLVDPESAGKSYDLCGPRVYRLRELIEFVGAVTGRPRPVIGLNDMLSYWQAFAMEWLPIKLMTRDNFRSMQVDNVCDCDFPFGVEPAALEAVAPTYLAQRTPRQRYQWMRARARRGER